MNCVPSLTATPVPAEVSPTPPSYTTPTSPAEISPTTDPCVETEARERELRKKEHKHKKSKNGGVGSLMKMLLEFFINLINQLLKLIGGGTITPPNVTPTPVPTEIPSGSTTPLPTIDPCP